MIRSPLVLLGALALSGCGLLGGKTPPVLMALAPSAAVPAQTNRTAASGDTITVIAPALVQEINTNRVPVRQGGIAIAYVKDAVWVDKPTRLFRRLLGEAIRAHGNRLVIDNDDAALTPKTQLRGTLIDFGYDARTSSAVVTFDAVRDVNGTQVMTRRFSATVPSVTAEAAPVGAALNQAANEVASQVADWVG